jgi:hypothetical protein
VVDVEAVAVGAVSSVIARCPHLTGRISSNDKTPLTDGSIDVYRSANKDKGALLGRVPVQVKGRTKKVKRSAQTVTWPIDRPTLDFLKSDGGGIYFVVPVSQSGAARGVFYVALMPFKLGRLISSMPPEQKSLTVTMKRLPDEPSAIERIVHLALDGRKQINPISLEDVLPVLESLNVTTLTRISDADPTILDLGHTDFTVVARTTSGSLIPIDVDLALYPGQNPSREDLSISCGGVDFTTSRVERLDADTSCVVLSKGLAIRVRQVEGGLKTDIDLTMAGSLHDQLDDLTFFLAAAEGAPVVVNGRPLPPLPKAHPDRSDLVHVREQVRKMVAVLDALDLGHELARSLETNAASRDNLLMLHRAIVDGEEVHASTDGLGRLNLSIGPYQIVVLVFAGADDEHRRIVDPFSPEQRDRLYFRQTSEDGAPKVVRPATLYEVLDAEDLGRALNLHVGSIAEAYQRLENRAEALSMANQTALNLLHAADGTSGPMADYLLRGAGNLTSWLVREGNDDMVYNINHWQTKHRLGTLTSADSAVIRQVRRKSRATTVLDLLQEACLAILLDEPDEVDLVLDELSDDDRGKLQSWPIWSLAQNLTRR